MNGMKHLVAPLLAATLLSGCSVSKMMDAVELPSLPSLSGESAATAAVDDRTLDTIAFADAYCHGDGAAALGSAQALVSSHPENPKAVLLLGIALDRAGRGVEAYRVLEGLVAKDIPMTASLQCGGDFIYSGTVTEIAQRRLFQIKTRLAALGTILPLPAAGSAKAATQALYELAGQAPVRDMFAGMTPARPLPAAPAHNAAPGTAPGMAHESAAPAHGAAKHGALFVHLGSYRTMKTLDVGWKTLRGRYAKALGDRHRTVTKVDFGKDKGRFLRLGVTVADRAQAISLCRQIKAGGEYCAVMPTQKS